VRSEREWRTTCVRLGYQSLKDGSTNGVAWCEEYVQSYSNSDIDAKVEVPLEGLLTQAVNFVNNEPYQKEN